MIRKLWPLVVAAISLGIDAYVLAGVLPQIADSLTTTVGAIGLGVTAFTGAYAIAGPLLSRITVTNSTRFGLLLALGVFNAANLITALSPNLGVFLGSRVIAGAGAGVLTAVATAAAAGIVAHDQRGRAMAMVTFGLSAGTVAGVPLGMLIGEQIGWRWTMGLVVAVGVISMLAVMSRSQPMPSITDETSGGSFTAIKTPQVALGVILSFGFGLTSLGLYTYMLPMAEDRGFGAWGFAFIWAWGIGGVAGSALAGKPIDALGSRRLLPILAVVLLLSFTALAVLPTPVGWIIAIVLWGASGWACVPTLQDALTRARPELTTSIVAFQMAAMYLGASAGSAAGSALLQRFDTPAGALPGWTAGVALLVLVLAIIVGQLSKKPQYA